MKRKLLAVLSGIVFLSGMLSGCGTFSGAGTAADSGITEESGSTVEESAKTTWETEVAAGSPCEAAENDYAAADTECYEEAETGDGSYKGAIAEGGSYEGAIADGGNYKEVIAESGSYEGAIAEGGNYGKSKNESAFGSYLEGCYDYGFPAKGNSEEYGIWEEKGYSAVRKEPLSTFSADVDTASYSNLRRMIREGYSLYDLPENAVRIEEMLNYFSYDYRQPEGKEPFGVTFKIGKCPWNQDAELVMIGLKTEDIDYEEAPASNLVFLLDVSGSMYAEDKLPLLQDAFCMLSENLSEKDRVSIVTYAGDDTVVLKGVKGNKKKVIQKALRDLEAGGSTFGSKGIMTAYQLAEENFIKGGNNRVILATDGDLNVGLTSVSELEELISEKKESGIFLSVLGFGTGNLKDNRMETLADKGNGNYAYIDSLREAKKVLVEEMSSTLLTVCKDVKLQVEFNPAVISDYRLIGYNNRVLRKEDFRDDKKDAGEIGAGHSVTALYEVILKEPLSGYSGEEFENLKYREEHGKGRETMLLSSSAREKEWMTLNIRYKRPSEDKSSLLQYPVSYDSYRENPDDDFRFAAAVAEFGLLASHSEYAGEASLKQVEKSLKAIDLRDEYKAEFLELVREIAGN